MKSKALLIGINYVDSQQGRLRGCVEDVKNTRTFLINKVGIAPEDIVMYTDEDPQTKHHTTCQGILAALRELVRTSRDMDFVWIHYSGHGSYVEDTSGDEVDRRDECLIPSDYHRGGVITDDQVRSIFSSFEKTTRVLCVFDCCHSGTIADLKYRYVSGNKPLSQEHSMPALPAKIMSISGCMDTQVSADAYNVTGNKTFTGALTSCLLTVLEQDLDLRNDPVRCIEKTRQLLKEKQFSQVPQICSSFPISEGKLW